MMVMIYVWIKGFGIDPVQIPFSTLGYPREP